jgi:hypothetical protein
MIFLSLARRRKKIPSRQTPGNKNGEQPGLAVPELVALPSLGASLSPQAGDQRKDVGQLLPRYRDLRHLKRSGHG